MPVVIAAPAVPWAIETAVAAGVWAVRAYRAYRAAKLAQAIANAEQEAQQDAAAGEGARTDAQAKSDAAASSECKDCNEDPDCETARNKLREALYGVKDEAAGTARGLAERICHWLHGTSDVERGVHMQALNDSLKRVEKARAWLQGTGDRPVGKTEGARLTKEQKRKRLKNCSIPKDLADDMKMLEDFGVAISQNRSPIDPMPRPDFAAACSKAAFDMIRNTLGA